MITIKKLFNVDLSPDRSSSRRPLRFIHDPAMFYLEQAPSAPSPFFLTFFFSLSSLINVKRYIYLNGTVCLYDNTRKFKKYLSLFAAAHPKIEKWR